MKTYLLFFSLLSLFILSCDSNPVTPTDIPNENPVTEISGKIASWEKGRTGLVQLLVQFGVRDTISTSPIDSNGNFVFKNLKEIDPQYLINKVYPVYRDDLDYLNNHVVCSDSTAGYMPSYIFAYSESFNRFWNQILLKNFDYSASWDMDKLSRGDTYVEFVYVDKDADLYGDVEAHYQNNPLAKGHIINHFDLKYKKGWNARVTKIINFDYYFKGDTSYVIAEYEISNSYSGDLFWDKY